MENCPFLWLHHQKASTRDIDQWYRWHIEIDDPNDDLAFKHGDHSIVILNCKGVLYQGFVVYKFYSTLANFRITNGIQWVYHPRVGTGYVMIIANL